MFLKKLFGGKKKSDFYLEIQDQESKDEKTDATVAATAAAVVGTTPPESTPATEVKLVETDREPPASEAPAPDQKKSKKKAKGKEKIQAAAPAPKPQVPDAEELARKAISSMNGKVESQEVTFAASSVINPTLSRRRPGPSLNTFKDMARKAKIPNSARR